MRRWNTSKVSCSCQYRVCQLDRTHFFKGLDVLVSNAGGGIGRYSARETPADAFDWTLNLNLTSHFLLTKSALPHLEKTKGNLLYVSSIAGINEESQHTYIETLKRTHVLLQLPSLLPA